VEDLVTGDPRTGHPSRILLPEIFCFGMEEGNHLSECNKRSVLALSPCWMNGVAPVMMSMLMETRV
jgi:hypothetical protein